MKTVKTYCPYCDEEHQIIIKDELVKNIICGVEIEYIEKSYYCNTYDEAFEDGELLNENLTSARNEYRKTISLNK